MQNINKVWHNINLSNLSAKNSWTQISIEEMTCYSDFIRQMTTAKRLELALLKLIDLWYLDKHDSEDIKYCIKMIILDVQKYHGDSPEENYYTPVNGKCIDAICMHERKLFNDAEIPDNIYPTQYMIKQGLISNIDPIKGDFFFIKEEYKK